MVIKILLRASASRVLPDGKGRDPAEGRGLGSDGGSANGRLLSHAETLVLPERDGMVQATCVEESSAPPPSVPPLCLRPRGPAPRAGQACLAPRPGPRPQGSRPFASLPGPRPHSRACVLCVQPRLQESRPFVSPGAPPPEPGRRALRPGPAPKSPALLPPPSEPRPRSRPVSFAPGPVSPCACARRPGLLRRRR